MKAGEISEPIKTQFGYHIIRLDEVQPERARTLADSRAQIEGDYRRDRASDVFGDRQERLQQKNRDHQWRPISMPLAQEFGLTLGEVPEYTRGGGGVLGVNAELSSIVFSDTVLKDQRIGGPVALADDRLVIVKMLEHHAPKARALAEVRADINAVVAREEGTKAARAAAESARKQLIAGASFDAVAKELKADGDCRRPSWAVATRSRRRRSATPRLQRLAWRPASRSTRRSPWTRAALRCWKYCRSDRERPAPMQPTTSS